MNCALETIERVRFAVHHNLKSLIVVVAAIFACRHFSSFTPHGVCESEQPLANPERSTAGGRDFCSPVRHRLFCASHDSSDRRRTGSIFEFNFLEIGCYFSVGRVGFLPHTERGKSAPTGKSLLIFGNHVKPLAKKYFAGHVGQITGTSRAILGPHEGRFAVVTKRRAGDVMDAFAQ
jgi:hypothetical protein